ncbi:MAG TPA: hypothetical protein IAD45_05190, partial [Candidatus Faecimonas intestinavium]|nr:hypothetical protein [Candidatus Faecimonas intestinavium]
KGLTLPIIGPDIVKDTVSKFPYALLEQDKSGKISGQRQDNIAQAGYDIGIYKSDILEANIATPEQIIEYNEEYPISSISEEQDALKFELTNTLGQDVPRAR